MRLVDADHLVILVNNATILGDGFKHAFTAIVNGEPTIEPGPTIEPERKGHWIDKGYGEYRCSSCRNIIDLDEEILMSIKSFNYCPNCGADMRGEQDGR